MNGERRARLKAFQEKLGYKFKDLKLLSRALTHRSYANEQRGAKIDDNERLEYLGDAVLELIISHHLIDNYPDYSEGDLSKLRSYVVSEPVLAVVARELEMGRYLLLGKGEERTRGRYKNSLLANTLEAVTAVIYLDGGLEAARKFIIDLYSGVIREASKSEHLQNFKSQLQEYTQAKLNNIPVYELISKKGPHHQRVFEVQVKLGGEVYGHGAGRSKKEAEQKAAKEVLRILKEKQAKNE